MNEETEDIHYECTGCMAGMEIYKSVHGDRRKHRTSFEAPLGKFSHIKKGNCIPDKVCHSCEKELLIRV